MRSLAAQIKLARSRQALSQSELANHAEVSLATLQNIEAGQANPSWNTVVSLLNVLRLKVTFSSDEIQWSELSSLGCPVLASAAVDESPGIGKIGRLLMKTLDAKLLKTFL